jgi:plasmid stabilization system protein ParE
LLLRKKKWHTENATGPDQAQEEISKLQAEIARLENNASMASKEA